MLNTSAYMRHLKHCSIGLQWQCCCLQATCSVCAIQKLHHHLSPKYWQASNRPIYRFNGHRCILWRWFVLDTSGAWRCRLLLLFLLFASFSARIFLVLLATRLAWRFSASMNASLSHIFSFWSLERRSWDDGWTVSNTGQQLNVLHSLTMAGLYQTQDNKSTCSTVSQWLWTVSNTGQQLNVLHSLTIALDCIKHRTTTQHAPQSRNGWTVSNTGQLLNMLHSLTTAGLYQTQDNNSMCSIVSQSALCKCKYKTEIYIVHRHQKASNVYISTPREETF